MTHPYRSQEIKSIKKLPRKLARIRGIFRKLVIPWMVFIILNLCAVFFYATVWSVVRESRQDLADQKKAMLEGVSLAQTENNIKKAELIKQEHDLNERIRLFEDTVKAHALFSNIEESIKKNSGK